MGSTVRDQPPVLVLTGGPAVGKTSTARALAETLERCAVIDVDDLRHLVVSGHAAPWEGEPGRFQRELGARNACALAEAFAAAEIAVVVTDVLVPATEVICRERLRDVLVVHLTISRDEAVGRAAQRPVHLTAKEFDDLHADQVVSPPHADHSLDVTRMTLVEQVDAVRALWLGPRDASSAH